MTAVEHPDLDRWSRWLTWWAALGLPGLCLALVSWGAVTVVGIAAAVAVPLTLVLVVSDHGHRQWDGRPSAAVGGGRVIRVVVCGVTLVVSITATCAVMPGIGILLVVLVGVSSPPAVDLRRRLMGNAPDRHHPAAAEQITPLPGSSPSHPGHDATARAMTDAQLCGAWRHSYWLLRETRDPAVSLAIVRIRHGLLDELENRNAAALAAWLASAPGPSQGPDKFLTTNESGDQPNAA